MRCVSADSILIREPVNAGGSSLLSPCTECGCFLPHFIIILFNCFLFFFLLVDKRCNNTILLWPIIYGWQRQYFCPVTCSCVALPGADSSVLMQAKSPGLTLTVLMAVGVWGRGRKGGKHLDDEVTPALESTHCMALGLSANNPITHNF